MSNVAKNKKISNHLFKPQIVFEDSSLLVINKPGGWVSLNTPSFSGPTIQNWVKENFKIENCPPSVSPRRGRGNLKIKSPAERRTGIAHRLDKDTWGLLLVAKSNRAFKDLQLQFKQRKVKKVYLALVRGRLKGQGEIKAPIDRAPYDGTQFDVVPGGKSAHTIFKVKKHYKIQSKIYSLVRVRLKTGRTHQIRVHFKYLGHPLFGDPIYGKNERAMFLVAKEIGFTHPTKNKKISFKIEIPEVLKQILHKANEKTKD